MQFQKLNMEQLFGVFLSDLSPLDPDQQWNKYREKILLGVPTVYLLVLMLTKYARASQRWGEFCFLIKTFALPVSL